MECRHPWLAEELEAVNARIRLDRLEVTPASGSVIWTALSRGRWGPPVEVEFRILELLVCYPLRSIHAQVELVWSNTAAVEVIGEWSFDGYRFYQFRSGRPAYFPELVEGD